MAEAVWNDIVLSGEAVRLEPLGLQHIEALVEAAAEDPELYRWSIVPQGEAAVRRYVETAVAQREAGTAAPFATVRLADGVVVGSTRFWQAEYWPWPAGHPRQGRAAPDAAEIGHTWLRRSAIRTAVNTEAKLLMLGHAFETLGVLRVCLHTDVRNERSRRAIERLGARLEGILRAHRLAPDGRPRDSARYSIVADEWPAAKARLSARLASAAQIRPRSPRG
jgi:RimJ/RimL family protein N-acetyltransferase